MLKGYLRFRDKFLGQVEYSVYAQDSFDTLKMYLQCEDMSNFKNYINAYDVYDYQLREVPDPENPLQMILQPFNPYIDNNNNLTGEPLDQSLQPSRARRLDIKKTNKYKTNIENHDFNSKVSAIIRYAQIIGKKNYNMELAEEIDPTDYFTPERTVQIDNMGYVKLDTGLITELSLQSKYVDIVLTTVETPVFDTGIFKELKAKDKYGNILSVTKIANTAFALSEETLGFEYIPPVANEVANVLGMYETIDDVIAAHPEKNSDWIKKRHYVIVDDNNLEEVMNKIYSHKGKIAFDTETTGLKINFKSRTGEADQLVGVVISTKVGEGYYFPLQHKLFPNLCNGDHWYFMEKYMKPLLEQREIICHNIKYDWKVAYIYDINVNCVYDTLLAFGVTKRYEDSTFELSLKDLTRNIFGIDSFELSDFVTGKFGDSDITFADLPYELVRQYAPADTDWTMALYEYIEREQILQKYDARQVFEIEVTFAMCVAYSEFFGYHINTTKIPEMREEIIGNMNRVKDQMFELVGYEFNPNSPQQLARIMYDELQIELVGQKRSTDKETLKTLADITNERGDTKYPFVKLLKEYRNNEGIFKNFLKKLHVFSTDDGYIFPEVMQLGTNTGRSSVKNPNYQSYNDPVKKNIVPRHGYWHFDSDFSQIEYRVLCSMAQQTQLMKEFDDPDLDYHTYQASRMFSIPYSLVSKELRSQSKGVNFGLPYGMGDSSLGARIFGARTKENTVKAASLRRKFFQGQEKIEQFFEITRSRGVANNFTSTFYGRRRYYNRAVFSENEIRRQAGNHVIQGTAADIYKISCNRLFKRCIDEGWLGKVLFNVFVHDEVLVEVHQSINPFYFFKAWREEFQLEIEGFCRLYAGAGAGHSWYEAKKQDLPPQFIEEIINAYHDDMPWDEDIEGFINWTKDNYEKYKDRRIIEYTTDRENVGEVIKPVIYALLVEMTNKIIDSLYGNSDAYSVIKEYNSLLSAPDLIPYEKSKKHNIKLLKDYLAVHGHYHNYLERQVAVISADEADMQKVSTSSNNSALETNDTNMVSFEEDDFTIEDLIKMSGFHRDDENQIVYLTDRPMAYQGIPTTTTNYFFQKGYFLQEGRYQIALYDINSGQTMLYNAYCSEEGYRSIMSTYNTLNRINVAQPKMVW